MVGDVVFVVLSVVVVILFAFVVLLFVDVFVVVEIRMPGPVGPSHIQHAFWLNLFLKPPKPISLS